MVQVRTCSVIVGIIAPCAHARSRVKRLLCVSVCQTNDKRSNIHFSYFVTDMYNMPAAVILASQYLIKLEVFVLTSISSYFLL